MSVSKNFTNVLRITHTHMQAALNEQVEMVGPLLEDAEAGLIYIYVYIYICINTYIRYHEYVYVYAIQRGLRMTRMYAGGVERASRNGGAAPRGR